MSNTAGQDSQSMDEEENHENSEKIPSENEEEIATDLERLENSIQYNLGLGSRDCCINSHTKAPMTCRCLLILNGREDFCQAVAEYQLMFEKLSSVEKKKVVIEWRFDAEQDSVSVDGRTGYPFLLGQSYIIIILLLRIQISIIFQVD